MPKNKKIIFATVPKGGLPKNVHKRLQKLPGTGRNYLDPKTGNIFSRRQYEKGRIKTPRKNAPSIKRKFNQYLQIRDSYIGKQETKGKKVSKRDAMNSKELKELIKNLHSKNPQKKKAALEKTLRGDKVSDWTPYLKRWASGDL